MRLESTPPDGGPAQSQPLSPGNGAVPRVSAIIPAYNYGRYLPKAIESVLRQEFTDYELIVVDDGSTDNTSEIVARYGDRVRYVYQKNAGLPAARNAGIRAARGEFVAFLDADDEWLPTLLKDALSIFARLPPEFAIVAAAQCYIDENSAPWKSKGLRAPVDHEVTVRQIIYRTHFGPSSVVARRAALDACGLFNPALRSSEDRDMWMRTSLRFRIFVQGKTQVLIRKHSANMSKNGARMREAIRTVLWNAWRNRFVSHYAVFFWLRVLSYYFFQSAWLCYGENRRIAALRNMCQSILLCPLFLDSKEFDQPIFFRLRGMARFVVKKP